MAKASDDEVVARLKTRKRALSLMVASGLGLLGVLGVVQIGFVVANHSALLQSQTVQITLGVNVAILGGILFAFFRTARDRDPAIDWDDPTIMRKRIDTYLRHWRWSIFALALTSVSVIVSFTLTATKSSPAIPRPYFLLFGVFVAYIFLLFAWLTANGPGGFNRHVHAILNDEFVRNLRARTMRVGYAVTMAAGAAALLTGIWWPNLAVPALAWALWAGFALPAFYYVVADWRATREEGAGL